ncbi:uncharacterized protein [Ptychodera flava]|uniref:uncharacterized protein n=1 Tax=Ptychodera flava TaxID=63121 RepID=UPI00396A69AF
MLPWVYSSVLITVAIPLITILAPLSDGADCVGTGTLTSKKVMLDSTCDWSYVAISQTVPTMSAFSLCVWMKSSDTAENGTLFSYATVTSIQEIGLRTENGDLIFVFKSQAVRSAYAGIYDGIWHFLCVRWRSSDGRWSLLKDDQFAAAGMGLGTGEEIEGGGIGLIGQSQEVLGGGFTRRRSFTGDVANFNMWSQHIMTVEFQDISLDCNGEENCGDVISWSEFTNSELFNVALLSSDTCGGSTLSCRSSINLQKDFQGQFVGNVITTLSMNSSMDCARRCAKMSACRSIDYSKENAVCQLSRGSVGNTPDLVQYQDSVSYEVVGATYEISTDSCVNQPCNPGEICQATCEAYECIPQVPTCANCTNPGTPLNGQQSGGYQHGDTVTFDCDVGYTLDGADSAVCTNGLWSDPAPQCRSFADCGEVLAFGFTSDGVYYIKPAGLAVPVQVFCDMTTDGGGWTVIQNRVNKTVIFERDWQDYKDGFGVLGWGYWFGNDNIHYLTTQNTYILRVDVVDFSDNLIWGKYNAFSIADEASLYTMTIGSLLDGNEADQMTYHNGVPFSTLDSDNDNNAGNCAQAFQSAWWYKKDQIQNWQLNCYMSDLNKQFAQNCPQPEGAKYGVGVNGVMHCLRKTSMKVRV